MAKSNLRLTYGKIHMNNIIGKKSLRWLAGGALMVFASLSHAQYMWLNEKGSRVYSDQPPPNSVPLKNILKSPSAADKVMGADTPAAPAAGAAQKGPPTLADREADFKKRALERAALDQKGANDAAQQATQKRNCDLARAQKAAMESGAPVTTREANGQNGTLTPQKFAEEKVRNDQVVAGCK